MSREREQLTDEELLERLLSMQRRMREEPEDILIGLADILATAQAMKDIPPVRFTLMACILLGQEEGLCFVRSKLSAEVYDRIFTSVLPATTH